MVLKGRDSEKKSLFKQRVFSVVSRIPKGRVLTYKEVAEKAGYSKAYRAVGSVLRTNFDPSIPCHRVVRSDGTLGEYNRGAEEKRRKLVSENAIHLVYKKGKKRRYHAIIERQSS